MNAPPPPPPLAASSPTESPAHSLAKDFVVSVAKLAAASVLAALLVEHFKGGGKAKTTYVVLNEEGEFVEEFTP